LIKLYKVQKTYDSKSVMKTVILAGISNYRRIKNFFPKKKIYVDLSQV